MEQETSGADGMCVTMSVQEAYDSIIWKIMNICSVFKITNKKQDSIFIILFNNSNKLYVFLFCYH